MTWAEIAAASRTDPMISSLIDCAQTGFARPLTHREMENWSTCMCRRVLRRRP